MLNCYNLEFLKSAQDFLQCDKNSFNGTKIIVNAIILQYCIMDKIYWQNEKWQRD